MKLNRRNVLIGLGGIAAGAGTLAGTGAFTSVTATRDAVVNVAGDAGALLSIRAADSPNGNAYVSTNSNGEVGLDLSTDNGSGVNPNAVTQIDDVLRVMNQGTQPVGFYVEDTDGNGSNSNVVTFESNGDSVEGSGNAVVLGVGESLVIDIEVDTTGETDLSSTQILSGVTFYADYAQSQTAPGQDGVLYVSKTASDADFTTIGGALSAVTSGETVLVGDGTYEEGALQVGTGGVSMRAESGASPTLDGGLDLTAGDITVSGLTIKNGASLSGGSTNGIYIAGTSGHRIVGNTLVGQGTTSGNPAGLEFQTNAGTTDVSVINNEFRNWRQGVYQNAQNEATYEENTFDTNAVGLAGLDTDAVATVTRNVFANSTIEAVGAFNPADAVLSENDFDPSNAAGVNNYGTTTVDARNNWWGASDGPSGGISDSDSSATANGNGVALNSAGTADGDINFTPFRKEQVFAETHTVAADNSGDFATLADAESAALPGDTLVVEDTGTEYDGIGVNTYGLNITAADGDRPTVSPPFSGADGRMFDVRAEQVSISGLEIVGGDTTLQASPVYVGVSATKSGLTVENTLIRNVTTGVQTSTGGVSDATIRHVTVENAQVGVSTQSGTGHLVELCDFQSLIVGDYSSAPEALGTAADEVTSKSNNYGEDRFLRDYSDTGTVLSDGDFFGTNGEDGEVIATDGNASNITVQNVVTTAISNAGIQ